ncbi:glycosyl hydrolase family 28 protein [Jiulongibacter sediminis]|uniref:glycosyl hydrolase family 28 protein n=1 Tax=Jiulongibacter sediminis TaxID=1605367 RepID=UPI0026F2F926|nr:glycosyl hydrolase family 28 protein [Jiulongibacter sediminis]
MKKSVLALLLISFLVAFKSSEKTVRVFMIGDSTMANKDSWAAPETGWGQVLGQYFTDVVKIQNHAKNGRSTKSFRSEGLWDAVEKQLQPGDFVFIQFGHNDQKIKDTTRFAGPNGAYKANLKRYVEETKAKGAHPILLTPVNRRKFDENGVFVDQHGEYPDAVRSLANEMQVPLIDHYSSSLNKINELGLEASADLYLNLDPGLFARYPEGASDNTHFTNYGANVMAKLAADGLRKTSSPLKNFLKKSVYPGKYEYELPTVNTPVFKKDTFDIRNYGAVSGGKVLCHTAINQAIAMASQNGGGVVLVPTGFWLSGPIDLKSNVNLHLEDGSFIQFSDNREDYPVVLTTWEGQDAYRCHAPIWGVDLVNVAITGNGIMDGAGQVWKQVKKEKLTNSQWQNLIASGGVVDDKGTAWYPSEASKFGNENRDWTNKLVPGKTKADYEAIRDFLRPNMVSLTNCRNVLLEGITILNSPAWTLHPLLCKHITIKNVNVKNPWYGQNNDAIDVESCTYGILDGCTFDTGDDAITIKSGRDEQGRERGVPTSQFIVTNTTVFHGHGGFVIGSEMSGGVNNLFVNNCNFLGTDIGLRFKTTRGRGGVVKDIYISDINMNNILGDAIRFNMYYEEKDPVPLAGEVRGLPAMEFKPVDAGTPVFRNFKMERIYCKGAAMAIMMKGIPESQVENIEITDAVIYSDKAISITEAKDISLKNVSVFSKDASKMVQLNNVSSLSIDNLEYTAGKKVFIEVNGDRSKDISIQNTKTEGIETKAEFLSGAKRSGVRWRNKK